MSSKIFISHATEDDDFVQELRQQLEAHRLSTWVDSRNLVAGQRLDPEIETAIRNASHVIVVLSKETVNSAWVRKEVQHAQKIEAKREAEGYRVIPLLLEGMKPSALGNWFDEDPLAVPIELKAGGLSEAMPALFAALGRREPDDPQPQTPVDAQPIEELILRFEDAKVTTRKGKRRVNATARLTYTPARDTRRFVESSRFTFTAPLGAIETEELRWYLEQYHIWPVGLFRDRAERTEAQLPAWGNFCTTRSRIRTLPRNR